MRAVVELRVWPVRGKFTELRQRLLFVLRALIVYRIGCFIPGAGREPEAMLQLMESQKGTIVDMFNMFSGGACPFQPVRIERDAVHLGVHRHAVDGPRSPA